MERVKRDLEKKKKIESTRSMNHLTSEDLGGLHIRIWGMISYVMRTRHLSKSIGVARSYTLSPVVIVQSELLTGSPSSGSWIGLVSTLMQLGQEEMLEGEPDIPNR